MADVTFGLTQQEIEPEKWPPEIAKPVSNEGHGAFVQVGEPITNDRDSKVYDAKKPNNGRVTHPVNTVEVSMAPAGAPVSNDRTAVINTNRAHASAAPMPPEGQPLPGTAIKTADVQILRAGQQPITNDHGPAVIHHIKPARTDLPDPPAEYVNVPQAGAFISNEKNVTYSSSPPRSVPDHERVVPGRRNTHTTPTVYSSGDVTMGKNAGHVAQGTTEVNIPQEGGDAAIFVNTDVSIGGGGDNTKDVRSEEVSFGAIGRGIRK